MEKQKFSQERKDGLAVTLALWGMISFYTIMTYGSLFIASKFSRQIPKYSDYTSLGIPYHKEIPTIGVSSTGVITEGLYKGKDITSALFQVPTNKISKLMNKVRKKD